MEEYGDRSTIPYDRKVKGTVHLSPNTVGEVLTLNLARGGGVAIPLVAK